MRVKKPQSKRKSTKLREGLKKKAAAHERKQKKLAKNDVTWKSRDKKDIGIPNSFPYKAQLLEEIESRKLAAKAARENGSSLMGVIHNVGFEQDGDDAMDEDEDPEVSKAQRLSALLASAAAAADEYDEKREGHASEQELEIQDIAFKGDTSRKQFDKMYKQIVDMSDVIVYVLDSRNPEGTRSRQVEHAVLAHPEKRLLFVLNKADLVPTAILEQWIHILKGQFPTLALIASHAASNAKTYDHKSLTNTATTSNLLQALKRYAAASQLKRSLVVGVVGYPNVGKSSIINSLCARHGGAGNRAKVACPVGAQAGVTTVLRKVKVDGKLSIVDSPGIVFPDEAENARIPVAEKQANLVLLNAVPPKLIEDPQGAVSVMLKRIQENPEQMAQLQAYYNLPPIVMNPHDQFLKGFLIEVARNKGRIMKGGIPDLDSAAMAVLTDWRDGRISGWSIPSTSTANSDSSQAQPEETKKIVTQWSQEFSLDGLWDGQAD